MEDFDGYVSDAQTRWRKDHIANQEEGEQNGKRRPWILPKELWQEGLWPGIRTGQSNSLPVYLSDPQRPVKKHDGAHNLKSSWVLCANLYFPFRHKPDLVASFLKKYVSESIEAVENIELEYEDDNAQLKPKALLGEPQGQRGSHQTSPDVAFLVRLNSGKKGLILTEVKFTEHSFYPCSGRAKLYGNPNPRRCMNAQHVYANPADQCFQLQWAERDRTNRKYWDYLKFTPNALATLKRCPASTSGYQLFRQQALAEALAQKGPYALVVSCVAYDARNQTLIDCLRGTGLKDFTTGWSPLFEGKAQFTTFTHQQWVKWVRDNDTKGQWCDWVNYVETRYALGGNAGC